MGRSSSHSPGWSASPSGLPPGLHWFALAALSALLLSCGPEPVPKPARADGLSTFRYPDLGFAIDLASTPKVQKTSVDAGGPRCNQIVLVSVQGPISTLMITVTDCGGTRIPEASLNSASGLRSIVTHLAATIGATVTSETEVILEDVTGHEYLGRNPMRGYPLKARAFVHGKRIYLVAAIGSDPDLQKQINSFTFRVK